MEKRKRPVPSSLFSVGKRALTPSPSCRYRRPQRITPPLKGLAMNFLVDTADIKDITELAATGLLDGVTTNPTLIPKSGRRFGEVVEAICGIVDGHGAAEVGALDREKLERGAEGEGVWRTVSIAR